jgi:hypothetical protein
MEAERMATQQQIAPIILDLGKKKKRQLRDLKRGRGRLMDDVEETLEEVRANLGAQAQDKELVPVIMIYKKKSKRRRGLGGLF